MFDFFDDDGCSESALIFLQGLSPDVSLLTSLFTGPAFGLSFTRNTVISPEPKVDNGFGGFLRGWFTAGVGPTERFHEEIIASMERIEEEIEYLIYDRDICPENIVIAGMSQGGALTMWLALFSNYELGGFIPMISSSEWLRLKDWMVPEEPLNKWTPILHINGDNDDQTKEHDARGKAFMESIFPNYEFRLRSGKHETTINPLLVGEIVSWAKENTNLKFSRVNPISVFSEPISIISEPISRISDFFFG